MNQQFDNNNKGVLFKNDKQGNENWPDYKGSINVNGEDFWLSAWLKTSQKDGSKFMSLAIQPKGDRGQSTQRQQPTPRPQQGRPAQKTTAEQRQEYNGIEEDEIPFTKEDGRCFA